MPSDKNIKVTVAMAAYNAAGFIAETIDSVLAQEYEGFELVVIDDGSTDATFDIIKRYRHHPRVRFYRNKKNVGVGATRNRIVNLSRGKYISVCDADDLMLPRNLTRLAGYLDSHPEVGAVYADIVLIEKNRKGLISILPSVPDKNHNEVWDLIVNLVTHPGALIRKSSLVRIGGYDETVYSVGDWDIWLKLAEITKIAYLKGEVYYVYRKRGTGISSTDTRYKADSEKIIRAAIKRRYKLADEDFSRFHIHTIV